MIWGNIQGLLLVQPSRFTFSGPEWRWGRQGTNYDAMIEPGPLHTSTLGTCLLNLKSLLISLVEVLHKEDSVY